MSDGEIRDSLVWFGFDVRDLEWLQDLIPRSDEFHLSIQRAIRKLEQHKVKLGQSPEQ